MLCFRRIAALALSACLLGCPMLPGTRRDVVVDSVRYDVEYVPAGPSSAPGWVHDPVTHVDANPAMGNHYIGFSNVIKARLHVGSMCGDETAVVETPGNWRYTGPLLLGTDNRVYLGNIDDGRVSLFPVATYAGDPATLREGDPLTLSWNAGSVQKATMTVGSDGRNFGCRFLVTMPSLPPADPGPPLATPPAPSPSPTPDTTGGPIPGLIIPTPASTPSADAPV